MREILGLWLITTALLFGAVALLGMDLTLKDKICTGLSIELVVTLIFIGGYLLA